VNRKLELIVGTGFVLVLFLAFATGCDEGFSEFISPITTILMIKLTNSTNSSNLRIRMVKWVFFR
ncbi:MAG TPA: hypothetical protein VGD26_13770, partial [Chitinophagaceae bacterium]